MKPILLFSLIATLSLGLLSFTQLGGNLDWTSLDVVEKAVKSKKNDRKIVISFHTSWCGWCRKMDSSTFSDKKVVDYLNKNYLSVSLDAEQKETIEFMGNSYKFVANGRRGYNELAAALLNNRLSYPSTVFLTEDLKIIQAIPGYLDPQKFLMIASYFGEDAYQSVSWEDFEKSYRPK